MRRPNVHLCTRVAAVAAGLLLLALAAPGQALAHAAFVSADPAPGARLSTAPGVVGMHFSEPINRQLSRATLTAPDGRTYDGAVVQGDLQIQLTTDTAGIYEVDWTTVSQIDGHTLRGTYQFGVRATPNSASAQGVTELAPQPADLAVAVARTLEDAALLAAIGGILLGYLASRKPPLAWARIPLRAMLAVALAAGLAVVVGEGLAAAPSPSTSAVLVYLTSSTPGLARVLRVAAEALAVLGATVWPRAVPVPLVGAILALAIAGHPAAVQPAWFGISAEAIHLLSAGLWAGGILALATLRPPGGWRGREARCLLLRFARVAPPAFVATVAFGTVRGVQELEGFGDLVSSTYGQVLSLKVLGVLAMVPLSWLAWRRGSARPRLEAGLAVGVVAAAALLAAFPLPPARAGEAEAGEAPTAVVSALPEAGDLSLAAPAGRVLVGLTLRPGTPGPNTVLLDLLPSGKQAAAAGLTVDVTVAGRPIRLSTCTPTCRQGSTTLVGGEHIDVQVGGVDGGTATFDLPTLPAPDGADLLQHEQDRMHQLRTYRVDEVLGPADPPLETTYAYQAPDRMQLELSTGAQLVFVGATRYMRNSPAGAWQSEDMGTSQAVPSFVWDGRPNLDTYRAVHLLGTYAVDGTSTNIISAFLQAGQTPIWFRLWVDQEGLVRQAEMRAQGHFMDHRYTDFDAPITITPPEAARD